MLHLNHCTWNCHLRVVTVVMQLNSWSPPHEHDTEYIIGHFLLILNCSLSYLVNLLIYLLTCSQQPHHSTYWVTWYISLYVLRWKIVGKTQQFASYLRGKYIHEATSMLVNWKLPRCNKQTSRKYWRHVKHANQSTWSWLPVVKAHYWTNGSFKNYIMPLPWIGVISWSMTECVSGAAVTQEKPCCGSDYKAYA